MKADCFENLQEEVFLRPITIHTKCSVCDKVWARMCCLGNVFKSVEVNVSGFYYDGEAIWYEVHYAIFRQHVDNVFATKEECDEWGEKGDPHSLCPMEMVINFGRPYISIVEE